MKLPAEDGAVRQDAPGDPDLGGPGPRDDLPEREDVPDDHDRPGDPDGPDSSDVIEGPIGAARLKSRDQVEDEGAGADLSKLPRA